MNDVAEATGNDVNNFADDTSVFGTDVSAVGLQLKLQKVVDDLAGWFYSWALTVNNAKSAVLVFTKTSLCHLFLFPSMGSLLPKCPATNILV